MQVETERYRVAEGDRVDLAKRPTSVAPLYQSKKTYKRSLRARRRRLAGLQQLQYADDRLALLVIFQGMDASGKDSAIKAIMSGVNPQGCEVHSFAHPTPTELEHDFLWRTTLRLPQRGRIGIFNRSYYEEVLIARVHPEILQGENVPGDGRVWEHRYRSIVDHERHLHRNGTRVVKFFLHLSRHAQRRRLLKRIEDPDRNWKFSMRDIEERACWDQYMTAYEACLSATSSNEAPWYVVPADDKKNARLIISQVLIDILSGLDLSYPRPGPERLAEMEAAREALLREAAQ